MHLTQLPCTALITTIRVLLQIATMYAVKSIVSRTYNLTYVERLDAGIFSQLKYIFMTRFPTKKHVFGRFMVMIALVISIALTGLPTLLNMVYPLHTIYLPSNNFNVSLGLNSQQLSVAKVEPGRTDILTLLTSLGVQNNNTMFSNFPAAAPPKAPQCIHSDKTPVMRCFGDADISLGIIDDPSVSVLSDNPAGRPSIPKLIPYQHNPNYYHFNLSIGIPNIGNLYDNISPVFSTNSSSSAEDAQGVRSVESCAANFGTGRQCVRHSLGYAIADKGVVIVKKKFTYQIASYVDGGIKCSEIVAPTLHDMCLLMNQVTPPYDFIDGYQSLTNTSEGVRWDILWLAIDIRGYRLTAISLDISIVAYAGTPNTEVVMNQELFEATNIKRTGFDQSETSWINWGFSQQDIDNMTSIILQGSSIFGGSIILTEGELLAHIPNLVIGVIVGATILLFCIGYLARIGVESTVVSPFSELIAATSKTTYKPNRFWELRDVANLTLRKPPPFKKGSQKNKTPPTIFAEDLNITIKGDEIHLLDLKM